MSPRQLEPAVQFGRYTLLAELGRGAMGAVYLATHGELRKSVALKVLHPHIAENPGIRERFRREGIAAAALDHPNVVNALDAGECDGVPFLVMEYLEGQTLGALLKERRDAGACLSPGEALELMLPVMEGVAFAHEMGVLHRDIKPENIFLTRLRNGRIEPKVLDFGIARIRTEVAEHTLTADGALLGTPAYMSPEQVTDTKQVDARSDQFSLAVVLYESVTGHRPIEPPPGATLQHTLNAIAAAVVIPPRVWRPDLPEAFAAVIARGLARDREARFPSVRVMMEALRSALTVETPATAPTGTHPLPPQAAPPWSVAPPTLPVAPIEQTLTASPREIAAPPRAAPARRGRTIELLSAALVLVGVAVAATSLLGRSAAPVGPSSSTPAASAVLVASTAPAPAPPPAPSPHQPSNAAPAPSPAAFPATRVTAGAAPPRSAEPPVAARAERRGVRASSRRPRESPATDPRGLLPASSPALAPSPPPRAPVPMCGGVPCPD